MFSSKNIIDDFTSTYNNMCVEFLNSIGVVKEDLTTESDTSRAIAGLLRQDIYQYMNKNVLCYFYDHEWVEVLSCELKFADPRDGEYNTKIIRKEPWRGMNLPAINRKEIAKDATG